MRLHFTCAHFNELPSNISTMEIFKQDAYRQIQLLSLYLTFSQCFCLFLTLTSLSINVIFCQYPMSSCVFSSYMPLSLSLFSLSSFFSPSPSSPLSLALFLLFLSAYIYIALSLFLYLSRCLSKANWH